MTTETLYLTERQAAQRLGLSVAWMRKRRLLGLDPRYVRLGRAVRYAIRDLDSYAERCTVVPRTEAE